MADYINELINLHAPIMNTITMNVEFLETEVDEIHKMMKLFGAANRTAFVGYTKYGYELPDNSKFINPDLYNYVKNRFPSLSSTYIRTALKSTTYLLKSQISLRKMYFNTLANQIKNLIWKVENAKTNKNRNYFHQQFKVKIKRYVEKHDEIQNNLVKVIFGNKFFKELKKKNKIDPEYSELLIEFQIYRNNKIACYGVTTQFGNQHIRLQRGRNNIPEDVRMKNKGKRNGLFVPKKTIVPWNKSQRNYPDWNFCYDEYYVQVTLDLVEETKHKRTPSYRNIIGKIHRKDIQQLDLSFMENKPYFAQLIRNPDNNHFKLHLSYEQKIELKYTLETAKIMIGIDVNPKFTTIAFVDKEGNLRRWEKINHPEMTYASAEKRIHKANEIGRTIVALASQYKAGIILEDLFFLQKQGGKGFNRMTHNFAYRNILDKIQRYANKNGVPVYAVDPRYTSFIGELKYNKYFGMSSTHHTAAYVIGRRGLGFKEKLPKFLRKILQKDLKSHFPRYDPTRQYTSPELWQLLYNLKRAKPKLFS